MKKVILKTYNIMIIILIYLCGTVNIRAGVIKDPLHSATSKGRSLYDRKMYRKALEEFGKGRASRPDNPVLAFDVGTTLLKLNKPAKALKELQKALVTKDKKLRARTWYNIGNTFMAMKAVDRAAEAFRKSLLIRPAQRDAKRNLELALKMLRESKNKNNEENRKKKSQKEQKEKKGKKKSVGDSNRIKKGNKQEKIPQKKSKKENQNLKKHARKKETPGARKRKVRMSKKQAEKLLKALSEQEKRQLRALLEAKKKSSSREGRDW